MMGRGPTGDRRILLLNQMAGPLAFELAEALGKAFGTVDLLTGHEQTLARGGSRFVRLHPAAPASRGGYPRRVLAWLRYAQQALAWLPRSPRSAPVLAFSNPPLLPWFVALVCRLRRQPYAVMVYDIYPEVLVALQKLAPAGLLARTWRWLNRWAYEGAFAVMTIGEAMAATLEEQFDPRRTAAGRVAVVYPWADTEVIRPIRDEENWFAERHKSPGALTVMYSGNMGFGHDIETILAAARRVERSREIRFSFLGDGPKRALVASAIESGASNVALFDWQPEEVLPYSLASADVAIVSLEAGLERLVLPSKTFYSLAAGVPVVAICAEDAELACLLESSGCGWSVRPGAAEHLAALLERIASDRKGLGERKRRSREVAEAIGSRANTRAVVELFQDLLQVGADGRWRETVGAGISCPDVTRDGAAEQRGATSQRQWPSRDIR